MEDFDPIQLVDLDSRKTITVPGAVVITKPDLIIDMVCDGGTGYHPFEYFTKKSAF